MTDEYLKVMRLLWTEDEAAFHGRWFDFEQICPLTRPLQSPLPLWIGARSKADVTLVGNLPNGRWICNDDFQGTNPGIVMRQPMSGQYDIWVGHYDRGRGIPTQVFFSEVPPN